MSGLVAYGSSDDEDSNDVVLLPPKAEKAQDPPNAPSNTLNGTLLESKLNGTNKVIEDRITQSERPILGPTMGPASTVEDYLSRASPEDDNIAPLSPYSANRARLRELTVPPIPNLDIPDSPPGSPHGSSNAKFAKFLELKKQGVHFNEKLAKSSALKNPMMFEKLLAFARLDNEVAEYATTLPMDLWDPKSFPEWAYKDKFAAAQQKMAKARELERSKTVRESLEFVPATASADSSRGGTPTASAARSGPKSAAERVMAGLDRSRPASPAAQAGTKRKSRFDT